MSENITDGTMYSLPKGSYNTSTTDKGLFKCSTCGKNYLHQRSLWRHLTHECGKEPKFQCPYCPHRSKRKSNITKHVKRIHLKSEVVCMF